MPKRPFEDSIVPFTITGQSGTSVFAEQAAAITEHMEWSMVPFSGYIWYNQPGNLQVPSVDQAYRDDDGDE